MRGSWINIGWGTYRTMVKGHIKWVEEVGYP